MHMAIHNSRPPLRASRFTIGRDEEGNWIVCDRLGLVGGIFADKESAVHFALVESDRVPGAVCCAADHEVLATSSAFRPTQPSAGAHSVKPH